MTYGWNDSRGPHIYAPVALLPRRLLSLAPATARAQEDVPPVIAKFKEKDPGMEKIFSTRSGTPCSTVGKGAIGIGGARGKGWVYHGGGVIGNSTLTQVSIGFQFGGQVYSEIVFFQTRQALDNFKLGTSSSTRRPRPSRSPRGRWPTWPIATASPS